MVTKKRREGTLLCRECSSCLKFFPSSSRQDWGSLVGFVGGAAIHACPYPALQKGFQSGI
eukprot:1145853-Pelagomonas_calceolata.AAC.1